MTRRREQMLEDLYLRNSARALVEADFYNLKSDLANKGFAARAMDRIGGEASDIYDEAVEVAGDNKGVLAALIAAVVLWFARNPIIDLFERDAQDDDETEAPEQA